MVILFIKSLTCCVYINSKCPYCTLDMDLDILNDSQGNFNSSPSLLCLARTHFDYIMMDHKLTTTSPLFQAHKLMIFGRLNSVPSVNHFISVYNDAICIDVLLVLVQLFLFQEVQLISVHRLIC